MLLVAMIPDRPNHPRFELNADWPEIARLNRLIQLGWGEIQQTRIPPAVETEDLSPREWLKSLQSRREAKAVEVGRAETDEMLVAEAETGLGSIQGCYGTAMASAIEPAKPWVATPPIVAISQEATCR